MRNTGYQDTLLTRWQITYLNVFLHREMEKKSPAFLREMWQESKAVVIVETLRTEKLSSMLIIITFQEFML